MNRVLLPRPLATRTRGVVVSRATPQQQAAIGTPSYRWHTPKIGLHQPLHQSSVHTSPIPTAAQSRNRHHRTTTGGMQFAVKPSTRSNAWSACASGTVWQMARTLALASGTAALIAWSAAFPCAAFAALQPPEEAVTSTSASPNGGYLDGRGVSTVGETAPVLLLDPSDVRVSRGAGASEAAVPEAECTDGLCPGEVNGTLNTCSLAAPSCVSVMSDDEAHFVAPWEYEPDGLARQRRSAGQAPLAAREAAVERLLDIAMGGYYEPGLSTDPYVTNGYSRFDSAGYFLQGALSSVTGGPPPSRPQPLRDARGFRPFDGVLEDRHVTEDGSIYLRIRLTDGNSDPRFSSRAPLVAEFLFPEGDNIVSLRCTQVSEAPSNGGSGNGGADGDANTSEGGDVGARSGGFGGRLALSFERGLEWDTNTARRRMEELRKALRWEVVPVVTEFDPKFNNDKPLWFERLYEPFRT